MVPISDDPRRFEPGSVLQSDAGELVVAASRRHGNRLLVSFEGVETRDEAETLRGPLFVPLAKARTLEKDEYWPHDLVGCALVTVEGASGGTIEEVIPGSAHDLLLVNTDRGERMIPLVKEIVREIDVGGRRVLVDPPARLLD